jgi:N-methylhydantoinase B
MSTHPATEIDPVTLQVIATSLSGIVREVTGSLFRTGFSTIVRESQDGSCGLTDVEGRLIGQHVVLPLHCGAFPAIVQGIRRAYALDEIEEGDAFITNHPYLGGSPHSVDMGVATPIFYRGELVGFACNIAHKSDLGGLVPGSGSGKAREIYHEGIHLPPIKYVSRGRFLKEIEAIVRANSRTPDVVIGDMQGQVGTNRIAEQRFQRLLDKYGSETVLRSFEVIFDKTEQRVRQALARWPDGTHEAEGYMDNDGIDLERPVRIHVRVAKAGDRIHFDFSGSDSQTSGPVNINPPLVRACCYYALVALIDPTLPTNEGLSRVAETTFAPSSVLSPTMPAPCNSYFQTASCTVETLLTAMAPFVPDKAIAWGGGTGAWIVGGRNVQTGQTYVQYELMGAGAGARRAKDGVSGTDQHLGNCRTAPIEIIESEFPVRLRRFELVPDSGGPGQYRGGLGMVREYELLGDEPVRSSMRCDRHRVRGPGLEGGQPGTVGGAWVNPGAPDERWLEARHGDEILQPGDVVRLVRGGGGGFGDPHHRDPRQVRDDLENGYVTPAAAREVYGLTD